MRKQFSAVRNYSTCAFCGGEITWHELKSGKKIPVSVHRAIDGVREYVSGAGAHFNLVSPHNCRQEAGEMFLRGEERLAMLEQKIKELTPAARLSRTDWLVVPEVSRAIFRRGIARGLRELRLIKREVKTLIARQDNFVKLATSSL